MLRADMERIEAAYRAAFRSPIPAIPNDYGRVTMPLEDFYAYAERAIETRTPLDWSTILDPLPPDSVS